MAAKLMRNPTDERLLAIYYVALYASIAFGIAGQLLMKWAALGTIGGASAWTSLPPLILALGVYSLGVLNWIVALRGVRLSVAYSLSSLNYVGILFGSYYWFGEQIGALRIVGVLLIFTGVVLVVVRAPAVDKTPRAMP
jgi:multidrug transporter EmrE-like cation transporter